jgi:hypothetical protein
MMATAESIQQEKPPVLLLDDLDERIVDTIGAAGAITLQALAHNLPEYRYQRIWYRVRSLSEWHVIRLGIKRGKIVCFSIGS